MLVFDIECMKLIDVVTLFYQEEWGYYQLYFEVFQK